MDITWYNNSKYGLTIIHTAPMTWNVLFIPTIELVMTGGWYIIVLPTLLITQKLFATDLGQMLGPVEN